MYISLCIFVLLQCAGSKQEEHLKLKLRKLTSQITVIKKLHNPSVVCGFSREHQLDVNAVPPKKTQGHTC